MLCLFVLFLLFLGSATSCFQIFNFVNEVEFLAASPAESLVPNDPLVAPKDPVVAKQAKQTPQGQSASQPVRKVKKPTAKVRASTQPVVVLSRLPTHTVPAAAQGMVYSFLCLFCYAIISILNFDF